ncbi:MULTISPECIES: PfkB family carbohydrate kinase [Sanguibacteroides]|uniref:Carbohydrate kinase PfkB domain-containing protein n=1 Tax=Sanguibacteroides justesenii TaxID=1547597 RepID=A0A0C3MCB6_9PORP|nr:MULTISPECIES: PfkB family carbohydrate kinase [Sanguibacteroides]KIO44073.1 hypothetical protein BA92_11895 [Sanguibacteroides justesenii]KIO47268.1 hypothetical protein IE90_01355 [Sanguibacteroides justesenii]
MNGLFIGLSTIDLIYYVERTVYANEKINAKEIVLSGGGPAYNAAVTFSALGNKSLLISGIGPSSLSTIIHKELKDFHISCIDGFKDSSQTLPVSSIQITPDGERAVLTNSGPRSLQPEQLPGDIPPDTRILLTDGHYLESAIHFSQIAYQQKIPTILDGGSWKKGMEKLLPWINVIICSDTFRIPSVADNYLEKKAYLFHTGPQKVAFTRGANSVLAFENDLQTEITVPDFPVVDTLGAGDIFHGAFCHYYIEHFNFLKALKQASEIASLSCKYKGTKAWIDQLNK